MTTQLEEVLHFYLGCDGLSDMPEKTPYILTNCGVRGEVTWTLNVEGRIGVIRGRTRLVKPVLRLVESMTMEELIEQEEALKFYIADYHTTEAGRQRALEKLQKNGINAYELSDGDDPLMFLALFKFLLKKKFDLFDLISTGQAYDQAKL